MNVEQLYAYVVVRQAEIKAENDEVNRMIVNAKKDGIDYRDWPQWSRYLTIRGEWRALRDMKAILAAILDPTIIDKAKEVQEITGVPTEEIYDRFKAISQGDPGLDIAE